MIRVMVVDDEKIVRKGLITFMPWQEFGMTVVGEASNGESALHFLENNQIDLLLTDVSMPVMSGIELMREVRRKYPNIQIVVLTLHQDFEYVQQALRLGAVDYIAKTELDKEQFEDVLGRIAALLKEKDSLESAHMDELKGIDELHVFYALDQQNMNLKINTGWFIEAVELDTGIWYWKSIEPEEQESFIEWLTKYHSASGMEWKVICFKGLKNMDRKSIMQLLRIYQKNELFYDYDLSRTIKVVRSDEVLNREKKENGQNLNAIKDKWLSGEWINQNQVFDRLRVELLEIRLPSIRLTRLFYSITDEWNRLYGKMLPSPLIIEDFLSSWVQFDKWLVQTREQIKVITLKTPFSIEIQNSVVKAIVLAQHTMNEPLAAGEIARKVNMSNSYFSQCFKEIVGKTYTEYVRDLRIDRAKDYLKNTNRTIQWVSEQVGYNDEKYFSRLFREHVGVLPSEYRQQGV